MANYNTIHVYPDGAVWVVKKGSSSRASAIRNTQREAYVAAREIAINQGLSVTVHGPDGRIQRVVNPREASSGDDCFITSACVRYKGKSDDCYELMLLRQFRDNYVCNDDGGKNMVDIYYQIGPNIVQSLSKDPDQEVIYEDLYQSIKCACEYIEEGLPAKALALYKNVVMELTQRYKIDVG